MKGKKGVKPSGKLYGRDIYQTILHEVSDFMPIDRGVSPIIPSEQTTVFDLTETTRTVHGEEVRGWECRECGRPCEEMYGEYEFCPHCRKKVVQWNR